MADLLARFRLADEMSTAMDNLAQKGQSMADSMERAGSEASTAFDNLSRGASSAVASVDGVASSLSGASDQTDHWTDAIGTYDKEAMEAIYTTEELVEAGYKTEDALDAAAKAAQEQADAIDKGTRVMAEFRQTIDDQERELEELQEAYMGVVLSEGKHSDSAKSLKKEIKDLSSTLEDNKEELEELEKQSGKTGQTGADAMNTLSSALTAAGITKILSEMTVAFMECSEAAAEFETATMKISTVADTTSTSLSTISADITALSRETGISVGELSEATYSAISASVDTAKSVEFTATATKLAAGGFTSSSTAVDVLTTALNAYGLGAEKAESISDMLITTQNLGKTTVDELAASVGKVIPLASAYGVEMDNLSTAYAELTKGGIATAEAGTYLKSMLNELGDSGSTVSTVLKEQTGSSFAQLMEQGYSLGDVMDVLGTSVNGDAGAFNELWSSSEAGIGALSLYNAGAVQFNTTLNAMQNSVGATASAYETMTDTTAHAQEELSNAAANLQISIGQQVNPLVERLYGLGTNVLNFISEFASEHPILTKAITAIGIGLGVAAAAMVAVTVATTVAIPAIVSFGTALNTALGPIGWVAMGITALVAAGAALVAMFEEDQGETEGMTAATRAQYYELQDLNDEYERACEQYGETSEEALRLKYQVDDLSASFEANRQTVEEFTAEVDALCESVHSITDDYDSATAEIHANEVGTMALIQKYEDLANKADKTAAEEQALVAVTKQLSSQYPDLADGLADATGNTEDYVEALKKACEQEAEEQRQQEAQETYIEALKKREELTEELAKAQENVNLEQERMDSMSGWDHFWTGGEWDDLEAYEAALEELEAAMAENDATIQEIEQSWQDLADSEDEATEAAREVARQTEEVNSTINDTIDQINTLTEAYNEAYEAAYESVTGQYGLWDEADKVVATSVGNINSNLQGQIEYWDSYNSNLESLRERTSDIEGLQEVIASFADGSTDSVNAIAGMAAASDADLMAMVENYQTLQQAQEETSASIADLKTNFSNEMDELQTALAEDIEGMNLSTEAAESGRATIQGFIDAANDMLPQVQAAYAKVAQAANTALSSGGSGTATVSVSGHATGTTNAEDVFMAGEDGPELIVGKAGSTVFPADETDRIINAVTSNYDNRTTSYTVSPLEHSTVAQSGAEEKKHITLEVGGGSPIQISGGSGVSQDEVVEILISNLRPALINIVKDEIFEEGDGSYEH